jgi:hypothetical protein
MPQKQQEIQSRKNGSELVYLFIYFVLENSERVDERDVSFCCYQTQTAAAHIIIIITRQFSFSLLLFLSLFFFFFVIC